VASYSCEVTQVNEMLTQMERHAFPFACTTNAPDLLDSATARRFLFKARQRNRFLTSRSSRSARYRA